MTTDCPVDPQSELGPEILAQATYQELAWMGIGSSNSIAYFSLEKINRMYNEYNFFLQNQEFFLHYFLFLFVEINFTSQNHFF